MINPYWAEWQRQTSQTKNWEFMAWIQAKWREFEPNERLRSSRAKEFGAWLKSA